MRSNVWTRDLAPLQAMGSRLVFDEERTVLRECANMSPEAYLFRLDERVQLDRIAVGV